MSSLEAKPQAVLSRLSVMMFLQFFAWGSWFATLGLAMGAEGFSLKSIGGAYESAPIAAIFAPLFLGLIADRFFPSEKVFGVLMLVGGGLMCAVATIAPQGEESAGTMIWLLIAYMLCYMPTLGLGNSITFTHLPQEQFPKARVWGTIGWIASGLVLGAVGWSASLNMFWVAAASTLLLGVYCFTLPHTPAPSKDKPLDIGSLLMLDAIKLLKNPPFLVFAICSMLICIPLGYYYGQTGPYLGAAGFKEAAATMTIGQMSEIIFMILIPFFFRKLGVKVMIMIGMACWVLRYVLFAVGAPDQVYWMLLMGVALHGICYDFFFVTGFIYTDKKAPVEIRGQAQSLLVFLTQGLGMFIGLRMAFGLNIPFTETKIPNSYEKYGVPSEDHGALIAQVQELSTAEEKSYFQKLTEMFSQGYPEGTDPAVIESAMEGWKNYWLFPAGMAAVILVIFAIAFWDKVKTEDAAASLPEDTPA